MLVLLQLWRAVWFTALAFSVSWPTFLVAVVALGTVERVISPSTQSVVAQVLPDSESVTTVMAMQRSVRNVGFSLGAALTAPVLVSTSTWPFRAMILVKRLDGP